MNTLANILETPPFGMVRRNHGIEHATVHILTARNPNLSLVGRADTKGFFILAKISCRIHRSQSIAS